MTIHDGVTLSASQDAGGCRSDPPCQWHTHTATDT